MFGKYFINIVFIALMNFYLINAQYGGYGSYNNFENMASVPIGK